MLIDHQKSFTDYFDLPISVNYVLSPTISELPVWVERQLKEWNELNDFNFATDSDKYDLIFYQEPYLELLEKKWIPTGQKSSGKTIYLGYGLGLSNWQKGHFELELFAKLNYIIAHRQKDVRKFQIDDSFTEVLGHGDAVLHDIFIKSKVHQAKKFQVLWAPHWSREWVDGSRGFSQWEKIILPFFIFALLNPEINFLVRSHPLFVINNFALRKIVFRLLAKLKNVKFSDGSLIQDIVNSSCLITDGVSIIGYFAITGKPILIFKPRFELPFNQDGLSLLKHAKRPINQLGVYRWLKDQYKNYPSEPNQKMIQSVKDIFILNKSAPGYLFSKSSVKE
jgi:hypothetical protein